MQFFFKQQQASRKSTLYFFVMPASLLFFYLLPLEADAATIGRPANNLGLVGYWNFDVGKNVGNSDTIYDLSSSGENGSLYNATGTANWETGVMGGAIRLDGVDDYIQIDDEPYRFGTGDFSYNWWINWDGGDGGGSLQGQIHSSALSNDETIVIRENGLFKLQIGPTQIDSSNLGATAGEWTMFTVVATGGSEARFYKNGVLSDEWSTAYDIDNTSHDLLLGSFAGSSSFFPGAMDEFRIYDRALSEGEIRRLYNLANQGGQIVNATPASIQDGLLGHWTFDGADVNFDNTSDEIEDVSGNALHLDWENPDEVMVPGKVGQAAHIDGTNDLLVLQDSDAAFDTAPFSITGWIKADAGGFGSDQKIVRKRSTLSPSSSYYIEIEGTNSKLEFLIYDSGGLSRTIESDNALNADQWYHFVAIIDENYNTSMYIDGVLQADTETRDSLYDSDEEFRIGGNSVSTENFLGSVDDFRFYNRVLTSDEVTQLYQSTGGTTYNKRTARGSLADGLLAHWTFDGDAVGTSTVTDVSGNGHTGTTSGTILKTFGKLGQAFEFDGGSASYVGVPDSTDFDVTTYSVSAWVYMKQINGGDEQNIVSYYDQTASPNDDRKWFFRITTSGAVRWHLSDSDCDTFTGASADSADPLDTNRWYHLVGTSDGTDIVLYIDGVSTTSALPASVCSTIDTSIRMGARQGDADPSDLRVDDIRFYNRVLTPEEIIRVYEMGT